MAKVQKSIRLNLTLISNKITKIIGLCFVSLTLLVQQSCNNEIDVFTEYKEQAIVYGLLDLGQETQFLKVGRTFLNPNSSAKQGAQIKDSLYFEDAIVKIIEEQTGREIIFHLTDSIPKDSGYFQNESNILYFSNEKIDERNTYRLYIENNKTGYRATGKTLLVRKPIINVPYFAPINPSLSISPTLDITLRFVNGLNAKSQDVYFEFWVAEFPYYDSTQTTIKKIKWRFVSNLVNEGGPPYMPGSRSATVPGIGFFDFFLGNIESGVFNADENINRKIIRTDFVMYSASMDLADFVEASTPSIGIVQKQTDYSNISNGLGVFSSRYTYRVSKIKIDPATIEFFNSQKYSKYNILNLVE